MRRLMGYHAQAARKVEGYRARFLGSASTLKIEEWNGLLREGPSKRRRDPDSILKPSALLGRGFYGEFDPGSGLTLAACLTHASRTGASCPQGWLALVADG